MLDDRTIPDETIAAMVELVDPSARVREAERTTTGYLPVYQLSVETGMGVHDWVLKATPEGTSSGVTTEARLLAIVDEHTSMPVPMVVGVVDEHDVFPAPYLVMERSRGENLPKQTVGELSDVALERIARESGRYLAELHRLDAPSGYGILTVDPPGPLTGGRPSGELSQLAVSDLQEASATDPSGWPRVFGTWCEDTLDRVESTRFGDVAAEVRPVLEGLLGAMEGTYRPAIGRVDHGLHNLLVVPDTGGITGVIDWAFTLSVPPAYDVVCVEANLAMDPWSVHPATPDRCELVRRGLHSGYLEVDSSEAEERFNRQRSAYLLLALLRAMEHLDAMPEFVMRGATEAEWETSALAYRRMVSELLDVATAGGGG